MRSTSVRHIGAAGCVDKGSWAVTNWSSHDNCPVAEQYTFTSLTDMVASPTQLSSDTLWGQHQVGWWVTGPCVSER
jgi:hypothetical protein